jgi:hypothetical protein
MSGDGTLEEQQLKVVKVLEAVFLIVTSIFVYVCHSVVNERTPNMFRPFTCRDNSCVLNDVSTTALFTVSGNYGKQIVQLCVCVCGVCVCVSVCVCGVSVCVSVCVWCECVCDVSVSMCVCMVRVCGVSASVCVWCEGV